MPWKWSLNAYLGCRHGCGYCYARRYHEWLELSAADLERIIFVKTNVAEVLRTELARRSWQREYVAFGTSTDPYQPIEGRYRLARACLEAFRDFRTPLGITTKGTLIVRDLDLLSDLGGLVEVHFSIITLDADLARRLEPGAPSPRARLRALSTLAAVGVRCSVFVAPVLPGITDGEAGLRDLYQACADAGAVSVHAMPLRLQGSVKPHFMRILESEFPRLVPSYRRGYAASSDAPEGYRDRLRDRARLAGEQAELPQLHTSSPISPGATHERDAPRQEQLRLLP